MYKPSYELTTALIYDKDPCTCGCKQQQFL